MTSRPVPLPSRRDRDMSTSPNRAVSLSPTRARSNRPASSSLSLPPAVTATLTAPTLPSLDGEQNRKHCDVALSKVETVLVSSTGDVLVARCRDSSGPYVNATIPRLRGGAAQQQLHHVEDICSVCGSHLCGAHDAGTRILAPSNGPEGSSEWGFEECNTWNTEKAQRMSETSLCDTCCAIESGSNHSRYEEQGLGGGLLGGAENSIHLAENEQNWHQPLHYSWGVPGGGLLGGAPPSMSSRSKNNVDSDIAAAESKEDDLILEVEDVEPAQSSESPPLASLPRRPKNSLLSSLLVDNANRHDDSVHVSISPSCSMESGYSKEIDSPLRSPGGKSTIFPLPSFDYSHFSEGGNDMIPYTPDGLNSLRSVVEEGENEEDGVSDERRKVSPTAQSKSNTKPIPSIPQELTKHPVPGLPRLEMRASPLTTKKINEEKLVHPILPDRGDGVRPGSPLTPVVPYQPPTMDPAVAHHDGPDAPAPPTLMHGVPTFLPALSQIRITKVSAHPLGSHVLLISVEALLFSYGLNDHGQLGHGTKSSTRNLDQGFVRKPTLLTPLLENGGKAVSCAAGVSHSLVVVKTDGRRVGRLQQVPLTRSGSGRSVDGGGAWAGHPVSRVKSSSSRSDEGEEGDGGSGRQTTASNLSPRSPSSADFMHHHQMYAFGQNDYMKLGLLNPTVTSKSKATVPVKKSSSFEKETRKKAPSPDGRTPSHVEEEEDVLLPRRVALHCKVRAGSDSSQGSVLGPPCGIFAVAASTHHSAALVRRSSGAVELYTWGNAEGGALGLPDRTKSLNREAGGAAKGQTKTERHGRRKNERAKAASSRSVVPVPTVVESLSYIPASSTHPPLHKRTTSPVGRRRFGETSSRAGVPSTKGKHSRPPAVSNGRSDGSSGNSTTPEYPVCVSLGPKCTIVVTSTGRCCSFGTSEDGLLGLGPGVTTATEPTDLRFSTKSHKGDGIESLSVGARHALAVTKDGSAYAWGVNLNGRLGAGEDESSGRDYLATEKAGTEKAKAKDDCIEWSPLLISILSSEADVSRSSFDMYLHSSRSWLSPSTDKNESSHLAVSAENRRSSQQLNGVGNEIEDAKENAEGDGTSSNIAVVRAYAGHDCSVFVTATGRVLSCGKKSGRLGQGEVLTDVSTPKPMFGGLHLWQQAGADVDYHLKY